MHAYALAVLIWILPQKGYYIEYRYIIFEFPMVWNL